MRPAVQGVEQSLLQALPVGKVGVDGLPRGFVGEAEAEASNDGGQTGAERGHK